MAGFFGFFDYTKPGKGISIEETQGPPFLVFWQVLGRKFFKFIQLNLVYFGVSIPLVFLALMMFPIGDTADPEVVFWQYLFAIAAFMLVTVVGLAPFTCGFSYVLRNFSREEHSFILSDFFEQVKNNYKQSLLLLVVDIFVFVAVVVSYTFYSQHSAENVIYSVAQWFVVSMGIVYYMMHFYIYQLMVTFQMPFKTIMKNALMLTLAKLPFNILVMLATFILPTLLFAVDIGIGVLLSALIGMSVAGYVVNFYANNVIYKLMIAPQLEPRDDGEEKIFSDDV